MHSPNILYEKVVLIAGVVIGVAWPWLTDKDHLSAAPVILISISVLGIVFPPMASFLRRRAAEAARRLGYYFGLSVFLLVFIMVIVPVGLCRKAVRLVQVKRGATDSYYEDASRRSPPDMKRMF